MCTNTAMGAHAQESLYIVYHDTAELWLVYASSNTFFIATHLAPSVKPIMFSGDSTCKEM